MFAVRPIYVHIYPFSKCLAGALLSKEVASHEGKINIICTDWCMEIVLGLGQKFLLERSADFYDRKSSGLKLSWTSVSSSGTLMWVMFALVAM